MRIPKFEAQTEWNIPTEFPDLRQVEEIAIDLETKDPDLKEKGSGSVIGNGDVIGIAVATNGFKGYFPIAHEGGGNMDRKKVLEWLKDILEYTEYKTIEEIDKDLKWYELLQLDLDDSLYIRKMLERKEPLSSKPRVKLSTIHAAKGGEADNVLLVLDMSKRTLESLQRSLEKQDEEHRVWYVGVTRAKQNLYFIAGKNKERSYDIESLG